MSAGIVFLVCLMNAMVASSESMGHAPSFSEELKVDERRLKREFEPSFTGDAPQLRNGGNMQVFGVLQYDDGTGTKKRYCEGALIDEQIVLTARGCIPVFAALSSASKYKFYFTHINQHIQIRLSNFFATNSHKFALIWLPEALTNPPDVYAFPTWVAEGQSADPKWDIREDLIDDHFIRLSSWFAADSTGDNAKANQIKTVLNTCNFADRSAFIALECTDLKVCDGEHVRSGATFFKLKATGALRSIALTGLATMGESGSVCKKKLPRNNVASVVPGVVNTNRRGVANPESFTPGQNPKLPTATQPFLCAFRFIEQDVQDILHTAAVLVQQSRTGTGTAAATASLPAELHLDNDVIPDQAVIGTMNVNGVSRLTRNMGNLVKEALIKIINQAYLMFLQEVSPTFKTELATDFANEQLSMAEMDDGLTCVYKPNYVTSVTCTAVKYNTKTYAQKCTVMFEPKAYQTQTMRCLTAFNVHLSYAKGDNTLRMNQIRDLRNLMDNLNPGPCSNIVIIAGDFNTVSVKETEEAIQIFGYVRLHDPGRTTPGAGKKVRAEDVEEEGAEIDILKITGEAHYDRIIVSENARVFHYFDPTEIDVPMEGEEMGGTYAILSQEERLKEMRNKFNPNHPVRDEQPTARNYFLSDHLPVGFSPIGTSTFRLGTWNMELFDPTKQNGQADDKEMKYKNEFTSVLNQFDVLAVQELKTKNYNTPGEFDPTPPGRVFKEITNLANFNRKWVISTKVPELGFAYDASVTLVDCKHFPMTKYAVIDGKDYRDAFECTFQKGTKTVRLICAHVLNSHSTQGAGRNYVKEAQLDKTYEAYVVGDFNMNTPAGATTCVHRNSPDNWEYTMALSKHVRDYVWMAVDNNKYAPAHNFPGTANCYVMNGEIATDHLSGEDVISDATPESQMKAFASWKEISDHYPVYVQFETAGAFLSKYD